MTLPAPTYDLVILLDPQAEPDARAKIVADTRSTVEGQGELLRHDDWGDRPLTYPIEKRTSAEYHLLQFHAGTTDLLSNLDRTLRITDGVLRFRIVKLKPGVPEAPNMGAVARPDAEAGAPSAPSEVAPSEVAPSEVAPSEVAPSEVAPSEVAPSESATPESATPEPEAAPGAEVPPAAEEPAAAAPEAAIAEPA